MGIVVVVSHFHDETEKMADFDNLDDLGLGAENELFDNIQDDDGGGGREDEAQEEKKPKKKKVKISGTKTRFTLTPKHLTNDKTGLPAMLNHFKDVKYSTAKDAEYANLDLFMSRLERFTHQLYPKSTMEPTLFEIETLGKTGLVRNIAERIRTDCIDDYLQMTKDITTSAGDGVERRGEEPVEDDYGPFDDVIRGQSKKRPNEAPTTPLEPKPKVTITDEQRDRMAVSRARALAKKAERQEAEEAARQAAEEEAITNAAD